jgi:hypothetical protein
MKLLDNLKEIIRYWKFSKDALDRTLWRTHFGKDYGPAVRQSTRLMRYVFYIFSSSKLN